jgi:hypothetical protein
LNLFLARQLNLLFENLEASKKLCAQIREETSGTHLGDLANSAYMVEKAIDIVSKQLYVSMCTAENKISLTF